MRLCRWGSMRLHLALLEKSAQCSSAGLVLGAYSRNGLKVFMEFNVILMCVIWYQS